MGTILTLHGSLVPSVDTRLVLVLIITLARLLRLRGLLQLVDSLTRVVLRLLGHVRVIDSSLSRKMPSQPRLPVKCDARTYLVTSELTSGQRHVDGVHGACGNASFVVW